MSERLYDLGVENIEGQREKTKVFAWPVAAWRCYIPDSLVPDINILEKVVLTLISRGLAESSGDIRAILCHQVGMNEELVNNVVASCIEKYCDRRHSKLILKADAKKKLDSVENGISPRETPSEAMKSIYLFQDLISQSVIPCLNVTELPKEYLQVEEGEFIQVGHEKLGYYTDQQPKTILINNAIRQWGRISRQMSAGDSEEITRIDITDEAPEASDSDDDVEVEIPGTELQNPEEKSSRIRMDNSLKHDEVARIAIYDDKPTKLWVKGYFVFDPDYPDEAEIISPFGSAYNGWFRRVVRHRLLDDEEFRIELKLFKDDTIERLKGKVAFNNNLEIALFNELPLICNDPARFGLLKKSIEDLSKSHNKIIHGENEAKHFAGDLRIALDVLFKCAIKENHLLLEADQILALGSQCPNPTTQDDRKNTARWRKSRYDTLLSQLASNIKLDRETLNKFKSYKIFNNLENDFNNKHDLDRASNTKDLLAMILVYSAARPHGKYREFVTNFQEYLGVAYDMTLLGNGAIHSGDAAVSLSQANEYYAKFEMMVRLVYSGLMEGA